MAEARKLLAEFAELLIPGRATFNSSWGQFLGIMQKAEAEELQQLREFLNAHLPVCFYRTRTGAVEFLEGILLARRIRSFAWCFKHLGLQGLPVEARAWCEDVARAEVPGDVDARGLEDMLSAKFAVRMLLQERDQFRPAPATRVEPLPAGRITQPETGFRNRLSFDLLSA